MRLGPWLARELPFEPGHALLVDDGGSGHRQLDAAQVPIAGLALREPSLDDVFLSLTGHRTEVEESDEDDNLTPRQKRKKKRLADLEKALPIQTGEYA